MKNYNTLIKYRDETVSITTTFNISVPLTTEKMNKKKKKIYIYTYNLYLSIFIFIYSSIFIHSPLLFLQDTVIVEID